MQRNLRKELFMWVLKNMYTLVSYDFLKAALIDRDQFAWFRCKALVLMGLRDLKLLALDPEYPYNKL